MIWAVRGSFGLVLSRQIVLAPFEAVLKYWRERRALIGKGMI